ncbi:uncharacterized protein LODBEIA_P44560 [Lodderomyces beijingensis]|uniref:Protein phosphatase methylesterase 1 n=1 Tax=Lodderomyces beijingensis TaxID=1775926 RepID=A0ABP0ZV39_9ASCO
MSDLQKVFLKRIKKQEAALGLSSLSEEPTDETAVSSGSGFSAKSPDQPLRVAGNDDENGDDDKKIIRNYESFRDTFETEILPAPGARIKTYYKQAKNPGPLLVCHHGAGSSSMTFGEFSRFFFPDESISIILFDMRGHGDSQAEQEYTLNVLVEDVKVVLDKLVTKYAPKSIFLLGHSLGGAVFAKYATENPHALVKGLILLDIIEETAISSLNAMPQFIDRIPPRFASLDQAIQWHIKTLLNNRASAEISVPHLLNLDTLTWKTDLRHTQPYWTTWFKNLSDNFIAFKGAKLLILSTHESLDTSLMIGQMQGKYQLVVFNNSEKTGHFVHEDLPMQVAKCVIDFIRKTTAPEKFMKDELGITPKWGGKVNK